MTYAQAGVSIAAGDAFVHRIKKDVRSTFTPRVLADIGAFGSFFDARFPGYKSPVLVSSVDGVGTKLLVARMAKKYDTVGQDLVNHCVNDILVCGAVPLYFLDYYATGRLDVRSAADVISGFAKACRENGCALVGGETAEMPGMYADEDFDLAGMIVGVVDKPKIVDGRKIRKGDVLIGLPSTGLHTNGYSLARAVLLKQYSVEERIPDLGTTLGKALLAVHRSYLSAVKPLLGKPALRGMSHITGGGIVGNTMRVVPKGLTLNIDWEAWKRPAIYGLIQRLGDVPEEDMRKTFNLGIGLILIVAKGEAGKVMRSLQKRGEKPLVMGEVAASSPVVRVRR
ncbi:MAG: phosphoribosylformylglycinamidine cyclo-ligase [Ignavibacteriae bacterium]|nr:phosphoribosylformylglycinamidine cyclo-ligase [Ignavibacteriota bacterium]